eukprot:329359_1
MESPLLETIEITTFHKETLTSEDVRINHQKIQNKGVNLNRHVEKLIDIFGGIDAVLQHYLSEETLTKTQLHEINNMLVSTSTIQMKEVDNQSVTGVYINPDPILYASSNNTFLHAILRPDIARKIIAMIFGKIMISIIIAIIIWA